MNLKPMAQNSIYLSQHTIHYLFCIFKFVFLISSSFFISSVVTLVFILPLILWGPILTHFEDSGEDFSKSNFQAPRQERGSMGKMFPPLRISRVILGLACKIRKHTVLCVHYNTVGPKYKDPFSKTKTISEQNC